MFPFYPPPANAPPPVMPPMTFEQIQTLYAQAMQAHAARELDMQNIAPELRGINGQPAMNQLGTSGSGQPAPSVQLNDQTQNNVGQAASDQSGLRDALAEVQAELNEFRTRLATQEANAQPVSQSASRKRKRMDNGKICTGSKPEGEWNDAERALKSLLATAIARTIREVTSVLNAKTRWPRAPGPDEPARLHPETEKAVVTYNFELKVNDPSNYAIIEHAAKLVYAEFKSPDRPGSADLPPFTVEWIIELGKTSVRGWKITYDAEKSAEKKLRLARNKHNTHLHNRRKEKAGNRRKGAEIFKEETGIDVAPLIHEDWMSDELGTEPEDEPNWKVNLLKSKGMYDGVKHQIKTFGVFETVKPNWRSEKFEDLMHWMDHVLEAQSQDKEKKTGAKRRLRLYNDRTTDKPPGRTPPNFAVDPDWLKNCGKVQYAEETKMYLKMPDVPGFAGDEFEAPYHKVDGELFPIESDDD
ncbi:hypothetical protein BOTBODRAFT_181637 [Botryobasidium botryosum FD-172 SS1]|uniref:Uncharacterized protein n=1 Tax=Botryobasidium botryosum (strain FD-172 SS1) TaxID=930990 RepID=A0A067LTL0_BOTB1|nr:hypothetical protein BOTBODRAFT_181637 [Botryobasidium botryosum FD-172 SS1]